MENSSSISLTGRRPGVQDLAEGGASWRNSPTVPSGTQSWYSPTLCTPHTLISFSLLDSMMYINLLFIGFFESEMSCLLGFLLNPFPQKALAHGGHLSIHRSNVLDPHPVWGTCHGHGLQFDRTHTASRPIGKNKPISTLFPRMEGEGCYLKFRLGSS